MTNIVEKHSQNLQSLKPTIAEMEDEKKKKIYRVEDEKNNKLYILRICVYS